MSDPTAKLASNQLVRIGYREPGIDNLLAQIASEDCPWTRHFNQNEEFFVELADEFSVPSLPIHHDVRRSRPSAAYAESVAAVLAQLARLAPGMLRGLAYAFDPTDIFKPRFHRLYRCGNRCYVYLLTLDLAFRPQEHVLAARGTNDATASYRGRRLFVEALFVPITSTEPVSSAGEDILAYEVAPSFSQTWLGERGWGYFVQGIWIDHDLTKFFSKLFLPPDVRCYPFYPFVCRYRTICEAVIDLGPSGRARRLPYLHAALDFIRPALDRIERELRGAAFSEKLPIFRELKAALASEWDSFYRGLRVRAYLNPSGMREFVVESEHG